MQTRTSLILVGLGLAVVLALVARPACDPERGGASAPSATQAPREQPASSEAGALDAAQDTSAPPPRTPESLPTRESLPTTEASPAFASTAVVTVVRAGTGAPVPGAEVWVAPQRPGAGVPSDLEFRLRAGALEAHDEDALRLVADEQGRVRVPSDGGIHAIVARADGAWGCSSFDAAREQAATVELVPDEELRVRVVDAGGVPVPGVVVALRQRRLVALDLLLAKTGEDGDLAVLRHVSWVLRAHGVAREGLSVAVQGLFDPPVEQRVDWRAAAQDPPCLVLRPSGTCEIVVVDRSGAPVRVPLEARLAFDEGPRAWNEGRFETISSRQGAGLVFSRVELGRALVARVSPEGSGGRLEARGPGPVKPGERVELRLPLGDDVAILSGRVLDREGRPVGRARLSARLEHAGGAGDGSLWSLDTASDGRFDVVVPPLPEAQDPRSLAVERRSPGGAPLAVARRALPFAEVAARCELGDFVLSDVPLLAAGVVVDATGQPVAAATVEATALASAAVPDTLEPGAAGQVWTCRTDVHGRFDLRGEGRLRALQLEARKEGLAGETLVASPGERDLRLVLVEAGAIAGRVLLDPSLAAAPLLVQAEREEVPREGVARTRPAPVAVEAGGSFTLPELRAGSWSVAVVYATSGLELGRVENVRVEAGARARDPRLEPLDLRDRWRALELELVDGTGAPVVDARAFSRVNGAAGPEWRICRREQNRVQLLVDGRPVDVVIAASGHVRTELERVDASRRVTLARAARVRVELEDPSLVPAPPFYIGLRLVPRRVPGAPGSGGTGVTYFDGRGALTCQVECLGEQQVLLTLARPDDVELPAVLLERCAPLTLSVEAGGGDPTFRLALDRAELEDALRSLRRE